MRSRHFHSIILLVLLPSFFWGQNRILDSLSALLASSKADTMRVNILNEMAWELRLEHPQRAQTLLDSALELARRKRFRKGEGTCWNYKGVVADLHGEREKALSFFQTALKIRQEIGDRKGMSSLYNNIGNLQENLGNYFEALTNYQQALRIREELQDTVRILRAYYNIAIVLERMANYPEALDYIFRYLEGMERMNDQEGMAHAWNVIGNIKTETDRYEEALQAYERALSLQKSLDNQWQVASVLNNMANLLDARAEKLMDQQSPPDTILRLFLKAIDIYREALLIRQRLDDQSGIAEIYNNMGYVMKNLGSFYRKTHQEKAAREAWYEAEQFLHKSLAIRQKNNDKAGIMQVYNGLADVRRRQERYPEALRYTYLYLDLARSIGDRKFQQNGLKDLARIHYQLRRYKEAYEYREQYDELRYSTFNEERIRAEERREAIYSDRKKQLLLERQEQELRLQEARLQNAILVRNSLLGGAFLLSMLALTLINRNKVIRREKQRSEELLLNILPAQTAAELKKHGKAQARRYEAVTVLFTDFKSFTSIAEKISPEELVEELDECFRGFDEITGHYGIEKIKTIGDAYFCVAGVPVPSADHAERAVLAALDMQRFMEKFRAEQRLKGRPEFFCRIGLHTGPVVAGVVGRRKFAYDVWGDTVNMGARMEQSSEPSRINISQSTYELIKNRFYCIHRGKIAAKNKGEVDMYFVEDVYPAS